MEGLVSIRGPWRHVRSLWPRWPLLPAFPFIAWCGYCVCRGEFRWELVIGILFGGVLPYIGPRAKRLYWGLLPIGVLGIVYDGMRFVQNFGLTKGRIHVCDLRQLEIALFGIQLDGQRTTLHDWLEAHSSLTLDVLFSIPYGTFIGVTILFAVFLYFRDYPAMLRFTGALLAMNVAAFVTYHVYPAAAPWYYHAHGCTVDLAARASEGPNLERVDAWLGFPYFRGFYGRSHDVFGAVPSLHAAYPLLIALEGWSAFGRLRSKILSTAVRAGSVVLIMWMCIAAVYLDHHWVIDVVVGLGYGIAAFLAIRVGMARIRRPKSERAPTPGATVA